MIDKKTLLQTIILAELVFLTIGIPAVYYDPDSIKTVHITEEMHKQMIISVDYE